ncbi:hypothetical protein OY671_007551, partial [Metschnikowia pulcherrima]
PVDHGQVEIGGRLVLGERRSCDQRQGKGGQTMSQQRTTHGRAPFGIVTVP